MSNRQVHGPAQAIVLFSGGLDSTACTHLLQQRGFDVAGLFVDFGQAALLPEQRAVAKLANKLQVPVHTVRIDGFRDLGPGELVGRNLLLISTALFHSKGMAAVIATGIHAGSAYFDCSDAFLRSLAGLVSSHTDGRTLLVTPFANWSKRDIHDYAKAQSLPVRDTYSCERGTTPACGSCASCRDRKELECYQRSGRSS